jgi:hypothetical protein
MTFWATLFITGHSLCLVLAAGTYKASTDKKSNVTAK